MQAAVQNLSSHCPGSSRSIFFSVFNGELPLFAVKIVISQIHHVSQRTPQRPQTRARAHAHARMRPFQGESYTHAAVAGVCSRLLRIKLNARKR